MQNHRRLRGRSIKLVFLSLPLLCAGAVAMGFAVHADVSPAAQPTTSPSLPPAKQALINHMNAFRGSTNAPQPTPPGPDSAVAQAIMAQTFPPCSRDLSLLPSGLLSFAPAEQDFPAGSYTFNNEWMDPTGVYVVLAGNVYETTQGVIAVETINPPTSCNMTRGEYLAPANSGSLTMTGVSGSTVSLRNAAGTQWTFDLGTDAFTELS
jgi:hypothetical protein